MKTFLSYSVQFLLFPILLFTDFHSVAKAQNTATCYGLLGQVFDDHAPCFPNQPSSTCCRFTDPEADVCLDTGLCLSSSGVVFQGGCTDPTGQDSGCAYRCPRPGVDGWEELDPKPSFWNLQICGADTYCCRLEFDTSDCCNSTDILSTKPVIGMPTTASNQAPVASATVGTATPGSGQTSSAVPDANPDEEECADSKAIYVGAGVGGGLGTLLAICIGFLVWQCRRNTHLKRELNEYRYLPKPAYHSGHGNGYAARAGMAQYGDKTRTIGLKDTTWKSFFRRSGMKINEGYPEQEEAGGNEILELPTIAANSAAQTR